jgi:uncharacterized protein (TIGR02996 family)
MSESGFLQAIAANPTDDGPRLIYADWLDEHNDPRCAWLRAEASLRGASPKAGEYEALAAHLEKLRIGLDPAWLAKVDRTDRYTMLWPDDYCRFLAMNGELGKPLRFVWGGHNKQTRFSDMKVRAGDYVYPLRVHDGRMYVVARMRVRQVLARKDYLRAHPADEQWIRHSCAEEVLTGMEGTPIRFDLRVPPEMLERLRFRSRTAERALKYVEEGRLVSSVGVQGIFRLAAASIRDFDSLLAGEYRPLAPADDEPGFDLGQ